MTEKKQVGYRCTVTYFREIVCGYDVDIYEEEEKFDSDTLYQAKRAANDFIYKHQNFESYSNFKKKYSRLYEVLLPTVVEEKVNSDGLTEQEQIDVDKELRRRYYLELKEEFEE